MSTKDREINAKSRTQISVFNQEKNKKVTFKVTSYRISKNQLTRLALLSFLILSVTLNLFFKFFKLLVGVTAGLNRITQLTSTVILFLKKIILNFVKNQQFLKLLLSYQLPKIKKPTHPRNRKVCSVFMLSIYPATLEWRR